MPEVFEWLNENAQRAYPFSPQSITTATNNYVLDNRLVLDLNLVYNVPIQYTIQLFSIVQSGTSYTFNFTYGYSFTTTVNTGIQYVRGTNNSAITINTNYLGNLPSGTTTFNNLYIEPSTVYEIHDDWLGVQTLSFTENYESGGLQSYGPVLPLTPTTLNNLTGSIRFYEGYNFGINFNQNQINLSVSTSNGIPLSCADQFINSADNDCSSIISYINGVAPDQNRTFTFAPGTNINLVLGSTLDYFYDNINGTEPANYHSLFISFSFSPQDLCSPISLIPLG